jgi:pentatricopeptide repeat protein
MYSKCGVLSKAQGVLEEHPIRNNIIWSALMSGYAQQGQAHEAFNCFERMQSEGLSPDAIAFTCALQACGSLGSISKGQNLHDKITAKGLLQRDIVLGNALVDMYAKCGVLARAQEVLKEISIRDIIPWNVIIAGYAEQGKAHEALNCFYVMQREGINPDEVTFVSVLNACGHTGLLLEAENVFADMTSKYGIIPTLEHYTSIVVAFGCSGHFDKAIAIIKAMSLPHHSEVWLALLGTCRKWGNLRLARLIFDQILQANNTCAAAYVLMSTILAAAGMQDDAKIVEMMRLKYGA